ncbi:phosphate signaling complex protein PhoU [Candidatus Nucleicultrix amoebiphila]|jgi:phosphate transport system protein|uniref:phosphate signaling complex protein PhoU n=1 Tax=Candidatus Nucleicultrix amoebiphila TaxID=1509244 RepID=UPI000A2705B1|nr:phosphate signaling complex protein PhoU [Candidatus Nucleicultrix amoebiphila]
MGFDHIVKSYDEDLKFLNTKIRDMGKMAQQQLKKSIQAIVERNAALGTQIIESDPEIDKIEHDIDTFAIRMIALRQPVAKDLRHVVSALKVSSHIERIADYATNIARRAITLSAMPQILSPHVIIRMADVTGEMIRDVINAYIAGDDKKALQVWQRDTEVDEIYLSYLRELLTYMMEDPRNIGPCTELLFVVKNLERIGDHTTNIAEMVHYYTHGTSIQEKRPKGKKPDSQNKSTPKSSSSSPKSDRKKS